MKSFLGVFKKMTDLGELGVREEARLLHRGQRCALVKTLLRVSCAAREQVCKAEE